MELEVIVVGVGFVGFVVVFVLQQVGVEVIVFEVRDCFDVLLWVLSFYLLMFDMFDDFGVVVVFVV